VDDAVAAHPGLDGAIGGAAVAVRLVPVVALLVRVDHAVPAARLGAVGPAVVGEDVGVGGPIVALLVALYLAVAARRGPQAAAGPGERGGAACGAGRQTRVVGARRRTGERAGAAERQVEAAHDREVPAHQEPPSGSADVRLAGEEAPGLGGHTARDWMNCSR